METAMEFRRLGHTGLSVSRICLGCMSYGDPAATVPGSTLRWEWALKEDEARPFFKRAIELGVNFFDTANVYSFGASEEITGPWCWLTFRCLGKCSALSQCTGFGVCHE